MKHLLLTLLIVPALSFSQTEEDRIKDIRSWYKEVEGNLENCIKIPLTMFYDSEYVRGGSTEIEGYYDTINKVIIKIVERTYYDWAEDATSYYFHDKEMFFIFSTGSGPGEMYTAEELGVSEEELWEMGGEAKTLNYYQDRYYYQNEKCIRHLNKAAEISSEEEVDMSKVENEKQTIDIKETLSLQHHGYKMFKEFMRQLNKE